MAKPWHNEETLRELYHKEEKTQAEVADELGTTQSTIARWIRKHDIQSRTHGGKERGKPWHNEGTVRDVWDSDLKWSEKANELGCDEATLHYWLRRHGIVETDGPQPGTQREANTKICETCGDEFRIPPNKEDLVYQCSDCVEEYGFHERRNQKISETKTGVSRSEEAKEKMSKSHMGKELSDEHRVNIGKANEGEKNDMYGIMGEDHPAYGNEGWQETEWGEVEETGHFVKSSWEAGVDKLLHEAGVDYGYEEERFKFKELTYTPDFTTENVIIEVKGYPRPRAERQAELLMERDNRTYIVVGNRDSPDATIPCDHHISYADRNDLLTFL